MKTDSAPVGAQRTGPVVDGWRQFALLAALTGFVGSVIGIERPLLSLVGQRQFHLSSHVAILSFVVSFGATKAVSNLVGGRLADRYGRRRVLLVGWSIGLFEPILIAVAPSWSWIVAANLLLGAQQGFCWTVLISMMMDRVPAERRGLATGTNEAFGYTGVALAALASGYLAARYGLRPVPFLVSFAFIAAGLALTASLVSETRSARPVASWAGMGSVFKPLIAAPAQSYHLLACIQAGLVANLLDALAWGLLPLYLARRGLQIQQIGLVAGVYPLAWGLAQGLTGPLSDRLGRRLPIGVGMAGQGLALVGLVYNAGLPWWLASAVLMGLFRALAYPTLLAAAVDSSPAPWQASALGVYRFYRDFGFVVAGLGGGAIADLLGINSALLAAAALAILSGMAALVMLDGRWRPRLERVTAFGAASGADAG